VLAFIARGRSSRDLLPASSGQFGLAVTGPKALEFYDQISNHRATVIKSDKKDILSVKTHLNSERQPEEDAETIIAEISGGDLSL